MSGHFEGIWVPDAACNLVTRNLRWRVSLIFPPSLSLVAQVGSELLGEKGVAFGRFVQEWGNQHKPLFLWNPDQDY